MVRIYDDGYDPGDLKVSISELLVATPDASDELIDGAVPEVLRLLRERMNMDVVFVSEFTDGKRVFRHVDTAPDKALIESGQSDPLEESWCHHVVEGRLPGFMQDAAKVPRVAAMMPDDFSVGTHMSTPIVLKDGSVYGTLCCFSTSPVQGVKEQDMRKLRYTAQLAASKIDQQAAKPDTDPTKDWTLVPQKRDSFRDL